jgi:hypothetical protein
VRFGTVVPLVTARSLGGREFTYELPDGAGKGAVVSVPFGRSRARGVVVEVVDAPPEGVHPLPVEKVVHELPATLIDLALYGVHGPRRALELAPPGPAEGRRTRAAVARGRGAPERLSDAEAGRARVSTLDVGGAFLLYGATGARRGLPQAAAAAPARAGTIVLA